MAILRNVFLKKPSNLNDVRVILGNNFAVRSRFSLAIYKPTTLLIKNSGALGDQLIRIYNPFEHL